MRSQTSFTTQNPEPRRPGGAVVEVSLEPAPDLVDASYSDERSSGGPWPSEASPTGVLTGGLGEMAFYYGACWLHHRWVQRRGKAR